MAATTTSKAIRSRRPARYGQTFARGIRVGIANYRGGENLPRPPRSMARGGGVYKLNLGTTLFSNPLFFPG
jgi:hypothetical protein